MFTHTHTRTHEHTHTHITWCWCRLATVLQTFGSSSSSSQPLVYGRARVSTRVTGRTVVALAAAKALAIVEGHRANMDMWCKVGRVYTHARMGAHATHTNASLMQPFVHHECMYTHAHTHTHTHTHTHK